MEVSHKRTKIVLMTSATLPNPDPLPGIVLKALAGTYSLINLPKGAPIPDWANQFDDGEGLLSLTYSRYGLSIICPDAWVPESILPERVADWRVLRVEEPRDWALHGLYSRLTLPLADDAISIYIVGSYNADHILVGSRDFNRAKQILSRFCEII